ncbi:RsmB/NOP family class I SAM-dependent RNA methyltransferase [Shewanella gelidimarina]|uniref:RsmB/NOP family class I SAM-dependent RNA methyltransferase n=1 Tax=Shewanella gelidimarina TaxID=56813 RepID=UPI00200FC679|nr:RsmB/NOP family class I SAM-dependent RNA methyltransferase [Shewanella gelidimarina]MCL1057037.1 RsmB/NOP family class I SAM-dependent RNA methyltransferase [Shewanella gelidimarina]
MVESSTTAVNAFLAETSAQKRAFSYSNTIHQLFNSVFQQKTPADRIVGEYFRANKKHGSKDRRVIRESLFALFRWWGWLKKVHTSTEQDESWFAVLAVVAELEGHSWSQFSEAWQGFANQSAKFNVNPSPQALSTVSDKCQFVQRCFPDIDFQEKDLLPQWFWDITDIDAQHELALIEAMSSRPPIWGRAQKCSALQLSTELQSDNIDANSSDFFSDTVNLGHKSINLNAIKPYLQGHLEIQDLGSQVIGQICAPKAHDHWWDACSGAGGKSLQIRSLMFNQDENGTGSITASDIRKKPLEELMKRAKRAGFSGISISPWQDDSLPVSQGSFDGVLVDAPCSCTGTWRRNPDMRWLDDVSVVNDKQALQLDILNRSAKAVKLEGQLVYATCSLSPVENEQVVNAFLVQHPQFALQQLSHPFTGQPAEMLTVWPQDADTDGMFVAKMCRKS